MAKYEKICDVAAAFKSGELSQAHVMVIADGHSVLVKKRKPSEDYDPWEEALWEGEAPLNVTAETCDALGIPHEGA